MAQSLTAILTLLAQLNAPGNDPTPLPPPDEGITCLKVQDEIVETNRVCHFRCGEEDVVMTVPLGELCPEQIQR
jgi:hypothetical protein